MIPLSMILYAACLHPFLHSMTDILPPFGSDNVCGISQYWPNRKMQSSLSPNRPLSPTSNKAIQRYERATGALLKPRKSKALAFGNWVAPATALRIDFQDRINVLGVTFKPTITQSIEDSWEGVICSVRAQAKTTYARNLCLAQRLQYVQLQGVSQKT